MEGGKRFHGRDSMGQDDSSGQWDAPWGCEPLAVIIFNVANGRPHGVDAPVLVTETELAPKKLVRAHVFSLPHALARRAARPAGAMPPGEQRSEVRIGRAPTNDLAIAEGSVSKTHLALLNDRSGWWMRDVGSRNGTLLDGVPLRPDRVVRLSGLATMVLGSRVTLTFMDGAEFDRFLAHAIQIWQQSSPSLQTPPQIRRSDPPTGRSRTRPLARPLGEDTEDGMATEDGTAPPA